MASQSEARQRLAELMDKRRLELRLTWQEVAEHGAVSLRALANARTGDSEIRPLTQAGIEAGLSWESGSVGIILAGGDPVPLADAGALRGVPAAPARRDIDFTAGIPEEELAPFLEEVTQEAYRALRDLFAGELPGLDDPAVLETMLGLPGKAVFPENGNEQRVWDDPVYSPRERVDLIARFRLLRARMAREQRRRTGTGLAHDPATSAISALVSVGGRAIRASS